MIPTIDDQFFDAVNYGDNIDVFVDTHVISGEFRGLSNADGIVNIRRSFDGTIFRIRAERISAWAIKESGI